MDKACGVYRITNTVKGKHYVGSSVNIKKRWNQHRRELKSGNHCNKKLQNSWSKHGFDNFEFAIVLLCDHKNVLMYEQDVMNYYSAAASGYNILPVAGTRFGAKMSVEFRKKLSDRLKGRVFTEEHRRNLSLSKMGHFVSDDQRAKQSATNKGREVSQITRIKTSETLRGIKKSPEMIAKMTATKKSRREETSEKMKLIWSERRKRKDLEHG